MKNKYYSLSLFTVMTSILSPALATEPLQQKEPAIQQTIESYLATTGKQEQDSGIAVSVFMPNERGSLKGNIVSYFTGTIGWPPLTAPITKNNLFEIGSITKSYTAAIILQLEGEGKLSINDKIGKWLPQYPNWKEVTIKQLLNMSSGIPSYSTSEAFYEAAAKENFKRQWTNEELLNWARPNEPIKPEQKDHFNYSNSNYILASLIIEKITGKPFSAVLKERIFEPFHFKNSFYPADLNAQALYNQLMPRMVHGYFYDEDKKELIDATGGNLTWAGAAGAIIADTVDVVRWVQILYHGQLFTDAYRKQALTELMSVISTTSGQSIPTVSKEESDGFGLGVVYIYDKKTENRYWVYKGSTLGYRVAYLFSPCNNITVAVALNNKAGDANPHSPAGDPIRALSIDIYKALIDVNPSYSCKN